MSKRPDRGFFIGMIAIWLVGAIPFGQYGTMLNHFGSILPCSFAALMIGFALGREE